MMYGGIIQSKKPYVEEFLENAIKAYKIIEPDPNEPFLSPYGNLNLAYKLLKGEELVGAGKDRRMMEESMQKRILIDFAKEMCELQKKECVKSYENSTAYFRVVECIMNAGLPSELGE